MKGVGVCVTSSAEVTQRKRTAATVPLAVRLRFPATIDLCRANWCNWFVDPIILHSSLVEEIEASVSLDPAGSARGGIAFLGGRFRIRSAMMK